MKAKFILLAPVVILASCTTNPNQMGAPIAPAANTGNQFGVPGTTVPTAPPYQPIDPINAPVTAPTYPTVPAYTPPPAAAPTQAPSTLNGNVHNIQKGDSLWGISRKYNTSVSAIKEANGMTSDTIIEGRTLVIPGR